MLQDPRRAPFPKTTPAPPRRRWLVAEGAARTVRRFREAWAEVPVPAWHRWIWTLTWGLLAGAVLMVAACLWTRRLERAGVLAWEADALRRIEAEGPMAFSAALWAEAPGNSVFMIPVTIAVAILLVWLRKPLLALATLASFFMLDLLVGVGWLTWDRARPTLIAEGIAAPGFHAFPSGHMAQMVSVYGLWLFFWLRHSRSWGERTLAVVLFLFLLAMVALARLRLGSHWPTDIVAGVSLGAYWLAVSLFALRRAEAAGAR